MMIPRLRLALLVCAFASAGALGVAFATEWYGGLVPCALCLVERWPYRIAFGLGVVGLVVPRVWAWLLLWLCVVAFTAAAAAAVVHVGVERGAWPSPLPECMAPKLSGLSMAERLARMPAVPSKPCEDPTYLLPAVPVSMAEMNLVLALSLGGGLAMFGLRNRRSPP